MRQITKGTFLALALMMGSSAIAAPIQGVFRFSGAAVITPTTTDFTPEGNDADEGFFTVAQALNTGDFAFLNGVPPVEFGDVDDRDAFTTPTDTDVEVTEWLEIYEAPRFRFTLRRILPGAFPSDQCDDPEANGQICTPVFPGLPVSPYNLNNFSEDGQISSQGSFSAVGDLEYLTADLSAVESVSRFSATFVANFKGQSFQDLLAALSDSGPGFVNAGYTTTVTVTAIPEPSTLGLSGLALLSLAGVARRFRK